MAVIDIYTDASYRQHSKDSCFGIGIFAIEYDNNEKEYKKGGKVQFEAVQRFLKKKYKDNVKGDLTLFELYAISRGVSLLKNEIKNIDTIQLYSDNLSAVEMLHDTCKIRKKYAGFVKQIKAIITNIEKEYNLTVNIMHIKSHCGVYGNVKADGIAKYYS
jgi:ribonuclease HI